MNAAELIRKRREEKGMLQAELADKVGISRQFLNDIELERRTIPQRWIKPIADALDTDEFQLEILAGYLPLKIRLVLASTQYLDESQSLSKMMHEWTALWQRCRRV